MLQRRNQIYLYKNLFFSADKYVEIKKTWDEKLKQKQKTETLNVANVWSVCYKK